MTPDDGQNIFDRFDDQPRPASGGSPAAPQTVVTKGGAPMSSVGGLPEPTEDDQARAARESRETAGKVPRQRVEALREYNWMSTTPAEKPKPAAGENVYDQFDGEPKDDGIAVMERLRLNRQDAYYRGTIPGSARLALLADTYKTPDAKDATPEIKALNKQMREEYVKVIADLAAHDQMKPFDTTMEAMAAFTGQLEGTLIDPTSWIGWGAKGMTMLSRTARAGVQQAGIQVASDPIVQGLDILGGAQTEYDPVRTGLAGLMGFGIGAGGHGAGELAAAGLGKLVGQHQLRKTLWELGGMDPAFDAPQHSLWALDPRNGIEAPAAERAPMLFGERPLSPPAPGTVRVYHGGGVEPSTLDELHVTTDFRDAEGWAARDPSMKIWYADVPRDSPWLQRIEGSDELYSRHVAPQETLGLFKPLEAERGVETPTVAPEAAPARAEGIGYGFQDAVAVEKQRLEARYGAAQPKAGRLKEEAAFNVFQQEAGPILDAAVAEHQLDPEHVRYGEIWRHYDRAGGESPDVALERAIGKWVSAEERAAVQAVDDAQLERDLAEWAAAWEAQADRMKGADATITAEERRSQMVFGQGSTSTFSPGVSPIWEAYRPSHLPEDIPFESTRPTAPEGGNLSARGGAQPGEAEAAAGGGAEPPVRGERGGERAAGGEAGGARQAAATDRGERLGGPRETTGGKPQSAIDKKVSEAIAEGLTPERISAARSAAPKAIQDEIDLLVAMGADRGNSAARDAQRLEELVRGYAPFATERTAQGEQTLIPGVAPVTDRERIEAQMSKPIAGGNKAPPEGGLFDEGARAQGDLLARELPDGEPQNIAQRRKGGLMEAEPVRDAVPKASPEEEVAIRSLHQQSLDLAQALDVPVRQGRVQSPQAGGQFSPRSGVIRVREFPDFDIVSHEAGHALEAKVGADLTALIDRHEIELAAMDYDPTKGRANEGFAEAVRYMMTNPPDYLIGRAPNFYNEFRQFMGREHPDLLEKIDGAWNAYRQYLDATSVDAIGSVVRSVHDEPSTTQKIVESIKKDGLPVTINAWGQKVYDGVFDDLAPFTRFVREMGKAIRDRTGAPVNLLSANDPEWLMRKAQMYRQAATINLQYGIERWKTLTREGPSLLDAVADALGEPSWWGKFDEGKRKDFSTYLVARMADVHWDEFFAGTIPNPPAAFSQRDAKQAMLDLERFYPNFRNASDMVSQYNRNLLQRALEGGILKGGQDTFDKLTSARPFYVPMMRSMVDKPLGASAMGAGAHGPGASDIVKRFRGSARDVLDPLESIIGQTYLIERELLHNEVKVSMVRLAQQAGAAGGQFVEQIPAHEAKPRIVKLNEAIESRAKELGLAEDETANIIAALAGPNGDPIRVTAFEMERATPKGEPITHYWEGGELKAMRVINKAEGMPLYELMTAAPPMITDFWANIVASAGALKRTGIITNPTFMISNYVRDQIATGILRPDYIPFYHGARGMRDEWLQGNNAILYAAHGGVAGGRAVGVVEEVGERDLSALARKGYSITRVPTLKEAMELASFTEAATRNSIFGTVFESSKARGLSDYEAANEAARAARDILDFSRHGSRTLWLRRFLPFFQAHLTGLDKAKRTLIDPIINRHLGGGDVFARDSDEYNNAVMGIMKAGALGTSLGAIYAAVMADKGAYRDATPYFKGTHFVLPWGDKYIAVPKPFELAMGFTTGEYAYHALALKDPRAARMFAEAAWDVFMPPNPISDMPIVTPAIEEVLGKSMFTKKDIVPQQYQQLPQEQQYTERTSGIAKWLGRESGKLGDRISAGSNHGEFMNWLGDAVKMSPIKIDYAIGSQFTTWGRDVMAMSQGVEDNAPAQAWADKAIIRRFLKDPTRSSDITTKFWDYMSQTTGKFNQDVKGYDNLVRDAVTRGASMEGANQFLAKLPGAEKAFVTLKSGATDNGKAAFTADERRLHPLQHSYDAVTLLNNLRRELTDNRQTSFGGRERIQLDPEQRRDLLDNVRELAQTEMFNGLVIMGEGGYAGRPVLNPNDTMAKIRAISPAVADEIATRYATAKIYSIDSVRKAWPQFRDQLVRFGSDADIRSMAFDAKADGYQFNGERAKKPGVIRRPVPAAR